MKDENAVALGKKSAEKRGIHLMTKEQRSDYMKMVRAKKSPKIDSKQNLIGY